MSFPCKMLASFLLICNFPAKGAEISNGTKVCGILHDHVNLDIPDFKMEGDIDDIRWENRTTKVARLKTHKGYSQTNSPYEVLANGTLKIRQLNVTSKGLYKVSVYNKGGKHIKEHTFDLTVQERVSKPKIFWTCKNASLTCEVTKGTDLELQLYQNGMLLTRGFQKVITRRWHTNQSAAFECVAKNKCSENSSKEAVICSEKGLDIYLIIGIGAGGTLLIVFVALLIFYISRRKKQNRRRNDEELEIRAHRVTVPSEERSRRLPQIPASSLQNPAASQPAPPPGHRAQAPGLRPLAPGHRVQQQPQKRPPPPSGTHAHQQKGPPLPRPRVQPKPPQGATENSLSPSSN
ncbi:T-cell surface antigen CD2 isoform X2 [Carlito syrichta]|uniref:T-cell surface antigen CD2 isoform X2 n=1 Tax=Carlito syrichta TaxID=1868482 RepID=A0A1U7TZ47_CARSF|nr:T-cell surface antigen CD2 isoform X2 [Carlito syrichta]